MIARTLTIAGSDSGGGAGIQADIKTFQELETFGMSAITAITAQNTLGVQKVYTLTPEAVAEQIHSVATDLGVDATKTGMLATADIVKIVAQKVQEFNLFPLVVDPVMVSTSGHVLLDQDAQIVYKNDLIPLASVVTPNLPEAEVLTGLSLTDMDSRRKAARMFIEWGAKAVVIKGGHGDHSTADDLYYDGKEFSVLRAPRFDTKQTHGTGCTFSAAITAFLGRGASTYDAVKQAKEFITAAIGHPLNLGHGHGPTNHFAYRRRREKR